MVKYKRVSEGLNRPKLIPINDSYDETINGFISSNFDKDYYETIYDYNSNHKEVFDKTKSVAGLTGLTTSKLVFDFDDKNNPINAKTDALELISRLVQKGISEENIQVYFSGNKGFHVQLDIANESLIKPEVDNIIKNLTENLSTADQKILDENRLFRLPLTKHLSSNLFKIPLTISELSDLPLNDIKNKASLSYIQKDDNFENFCQLINSWKRCELPQAIKSLKNVTLEQNKELEENLVYQETPKFLNKPKHLSAAKFALQEGFFEDGERNHACMILASTYRGLGYSKEIAYNMLKATMRLRQKRLGLSDYDKEVIWRENIEFVYSDRWKGGTYSEAQDELIQKIVKKFNLEVTLNNEPVLYKKANEVADSTIDFLLNLEKNRVYTGIKELDSSVVLTKGMMVGVLGAPSSGKTSFVNNFVEHTSISGNNCFYLSLDMSEDLLGTRMLGKYAGLNMFQLEKMIKTNSQDPKLIEAKKTFIENFKNVGFNFRNGLTVEEIYNIISEYKKNVDNNLTLVAVDYLEKVRGPYSDATASSAYVAARLADMAKELNVCMVLLLQPQKQAGDPREPLLNMRKVKGSSVIEQDCRVILTMWRPGFDPNFANSSDGENLDKYTSVAVVKQNMGGLGRFNFMWEPISGTIRAMTTEEKNMFDHDSVILQKRRDDELKLQKEKQGDLF